MRQCEENLAVKSTSQSWLMSTAGLINYKNKLKDHEDLLMSEYYPEDLPSEEDESHLKVELDGRRSWVMDFTGYILEESELDKLWNVRRLDWFQLCEDKKDFSALFCCDTYYYGRPRESFITAEAYTLCDAAGAKYIILDDLS